MLNKLLNLKEESICFFHFHTRIKPDRSSWSPLLSLHSAAAFVRQVKCPIKKASEEMVQNGSIESIFTMAQNLHLCEMDESVCVSKL